MNFSHLLPNARAWRLSFGKRITEFFEGLSNHSVEVSDFVDGVYNELDPQKTKSLELWEQQFGLANFGLTEQERRDRIEAAWGAQGGQDPTYIQDTLQAQGFLVYVHEWWVPGSEPLPGVKVCVTPRNPLTVLRRGVGIIIYRIECGEALAECGETLEPPGYPLVNKIIRTEKGYEPLCGEIFVECGEPVAECGNYNGFETIVREYSIPLDPTKWPYFLYIGGQVFGTKASVDSKRRDEFEALCLKICPTQQWIGIIVQYS